MVVAHINVLINYTAVRTQMQFNIRASELQSARLSQQTLVPFRKHTHNTQAHTHTHTARAVWCETLLYRILQVQCDVL